MLLLLLLLLLVVHYRRCRATMPRAEALPLLSGAVDASVDVAPQRARQPPPPAAAAAAAAASAATAATAAGPTTIPNFRDVATAHPATLRPGVLYRCACPDFCSAADAALVTGTLRIGQRVDLRNRAERPMRGLHPMFRDADGRKRRCDERLNTAPGLRTHYHALPSGASDNTPLRTACAELSCGGWLQTLSCCCAETCTPRCCRSRRSRERAISQTFDVWKPVFATQRVSAQYHGICAHSQREVAQVLRTICAAAADGTGSSSAILVHCSAGKDRTGVIVAIVLAVCGVPREVTHLAVHCTPLSNCKEICPARSACPAFRRHDVLRFCCCRNDSLQAICADYALSDDIGSMWVGSGVADPEEPALALAIKERFPLLGKTTHLIFCNAILY